MSDRVVRSFEGWPQPLAETMNLQFDVVRSLSAKMMISILGIMSQLLASTNTSRVNMFAAMLESLRSRGRPSPPQHNANSSDDERENNAL